MQTQTTPPTAAVVVTHDVESFERWKHAFDSHADARRTAGVTTTHINRDADQPNRLSVYMAGSDAARLAAFLKSPDLASRMLGAGVKGPPTIAAITPVDDHTQKRPLAGVIVRHTVTDYATWKRAFDGDAAARTAAGILGHAVNRSVQDPNTVIIYLQAESLDTLRAFTASPRIKQVMSDAGVVGPPAFTFVTGGTWES
jgi:heme-degrading monooxygenase HmoA